MTDDHRRCTSCGTARSTTPRASSTAGCRAITCPSSGGRWRTSSAKRLADRDITYVVSSPLERAQETAAPIAAAHGLEIATDDRLIEAENHFQGLRFGVGDGSLRHPGTGRS